MSFDTQIADKTIGIELGFRQRQLIDYNPFIKQRPQLHVSRQVSYVGQRVALVNH